jgi:hypothetical protein
VPRGTVHSVLWLAEHPDGRRELWETLQVINFEQTPVG